MEINRVDLADIYNPKLLAQAVLKQIPNIAYPVNVHDVARAVDILEIHEARINGCEGILITTPEKGEGQIIVKSTNPRQRQRFTIAHELGHYLNDMHQPVGRGFLCTKKDLNADLESSDKYQRQENEANTFATELLMPSAEFYRRAARLGGPSVELVMELAQLFDTSREATARRMVDICGETCAVAVSKDGQVLRFYKSNDFPSTPFWKGQSIPKQSITSSFSGDEDRYSDMEEITAGLWLNSGLRKGATLCEQVLVQEQGFRMTVLHVDESECDDYEEDDEARHLDH